MDNQNNGSQNYQYGNGQTAGESYNPQPSSAQPEPAQQYQQPAQQYQQPTQQYQQPYQQPAQPVYQQHPAQQYQQPYGGNYGVVQPQNAAGKTMGIVSLVAACLAFVLLFFSAALAMSIICIIFAMVSVVTGAICIKQAGSAGSAKGLGIAGIIVGAISLVLGIILLIACAIPIHNAAQYLQHNMGDLENSMNDLEDLFKSLE